MNRSVTSFCVSFSAVWCVSLVVSTSRLRAEAEDDPIPRVASACCPAEEEVAEAVADGDVPPEDDSVSQSALDNDVTDVETVEFEIFGSCEANREVEDEPMYDRYRPYYQNATELPDLPVVVSASQPDPAAQVDAEAEELYASCDREKSAAIADAGESDAAMHGDPIVEETPESFESPREEWAEEMEDEEMYRADTSTAVPAEAPPALETELDPAIEADESDGSMDDEPVNEEAREEYQPSGEESEMMDESNAGDGGTADEFAPSRAETESEIDTDDADSALHNAPTRDDVIPSYEPLYDEDWEALDEAVTAQETPAVSRVSDEPTGYDEAYDAAMFGDRPLAVDATEETTYPEDVAEETSVEHEVYGAIQVGQDTAAPLAVWRRSIVVQEAIDPLLPSQPWDWSAVDQWRTQLVDRVVGQWESLREQIMSAASVLRRYAVQEIRTAAAVAPAREAQRVVVQEAIDPLLPSPPVDWSVVDQWRTRLMDRVVNRWESLREQIVSAASRLHRFAVQETRAAAAVAPAGETHR